MERPGPSRRDMLRFGAGLGAAVALGGVSGCGENSPTEEIPLTEKELLASEKKAWSAFGYKKEIPAPPETLMNALTTARDAGYVTLEAHYLPRLHLTEHTQEYPGWKSRPDKFFWEELQSRRGKDAQGEPEITMGGYWVLVDGITDDTLESERNFPWLSTSKDTPYTYTNDPLENVLVSVRQKELNIIRFDKEDSRCDFSWNDLHQTVLPQIGKEFGLTDTGGKVRLMTGTEFTVLGNVFFPEWDDSAPDQLLEKWTDGIDLEVVPEDNGIASVATNLRNITTPFTSKSFRSDKAAFRPLVVFPH